MLNKVQIIGRVGRDPETRYSHAGDAIVNLSVATSESWKDKATGERKEKTEWHPVVVFGKLAEIASQYLRKGSLVYFEGKLQTRKWQDQNGQDRYTTEIIVDSFGGTMKMLSGKGDNDNQQAQPQQQRQQAAAAGNPYQAQNYTPPSSADMDDDIPF